MDDETIRVFYVKFVNENKGNGKAGLRYGPYPTIDYLANRHKDLELDDRQKQKAIEGGNVRVYFCGVLYAFIHSEEATRCEE